MQGKAGAAALTAALLLLQPALPAAGQDGTTKSLEERLDGGVQPPGSLPAAGVEKPAQPSETKAVKSLEDQLDGGVQPPGSKPESDYAKLSADRAEVMKRLNGGGTVLLPAGGLSPDVTEDLHADEAVALAMKNNFEVAADRQKKIAAVWDVVASVTQYLPQVEYSRGVGKEHSRPASINDANSNRVLDHRHKLKERVISIRQPMVDLSIISDVLSRKEAYNAAEAERLGTRERVALESLAAFYKLIQARLTIGFAETYKANLDRLTERMQARVAGGGSAQADLDRLRGRSVSAQAAIVDARASLDTGLVEFQRLTGVVPSKLAIPENFLPVIDGSLDQILARAVRWNPQYLTSLYQADGARYEAMKNASKALPKLSFEITDSRTFGSGGSEFANPDDGVYPYEDERKGMTVVSWTFNGGQDLANGMSTWAKAREQTFRSMDTRKRVEEAVRTSHTALNSAGTRVEALKEAVEANTAVARAFEEQFLSANRQVLDLLDAYERLYQSQIELVRLTVSEAQAGYQLHRQTGDLVRAVLKESED